MSTRCWDDAYDVLAGIDAELVMLDCPPTADAPETLAAMSVADLLMVPATPSAPDYWSTDEMLVTAKVHYPDLAHLVVLNQMTPTTLSAEMEALFRSTWSGAVAQQTLAFRTAYREAAAHGIGLHQLPGRKGPYEPAVRELEKVAIEVLTTALGRK